MLMLPELDTYGVIPAYAKHLDDPVAAQAFTMLLIRGRRRLLWDLHDLLHSKADVSMLMAYRLGMPLDALQKKSDKGKAKAPEPPPVRNIGELTVDQQKNLYLSALRAVGMDVDPSVFMNQKDSATTDTHNGTE